MVQSRRQEFLGLDREIDQGAFLEAFKNRFGHDWSQKIKNLKHIKTIESAGKINYLDLGIEPELFGIEMGIVLFELNADPVAVAVAMLFPLWELDLLEELEKLEPSWLDIFKGVKQIEDASDLLTQQKIHTDLDRLRKMFLSMVNDVRIVLVALARQQILMRHIKSLSSENSEQKAFEIAERVMKLYAPLANRLGIGQLKWELEDRAFRILSPQEYLAITSRLDSKRIDREAHLEILIEELKQCLKQQSVEGEITGRVKHIYSIYKKMQKKHLSFDQLFDIQAMRILVKDVSDCYKALGVVHQHWEPVSSEFDDYISSPKSNGYQSIHTVVKDDLGKNIEIQIRTYAMHEESEMGVAAHWRYKEGTSRDVSYEHRMQWLRSLLDWQREVQEGEQQPASAEVLQDRIYVVTPMGKVIDLERGCTPIDFAYAVHSEIGHRCRGAKIHGHIVPLTYNLKTGDKVEILTSKESRPSRDWLSKRLGYVQSSRTRAKIAAWFRREEGHELEEKQERPEKQEKQDNKADIKKTELELMDHPKPTRLIGKSGDFILEGVDNILISPAGCCRPVAGDEITGYITQGKGVRVHRKDCQQLAEKTQQHPERVLKVQWSPNLKTQYPVEIAIYAQDRPGLLKDLTSVIVNEKISIAGMNSGINRKSQTASILMIIDVTDKHQAENLCESLRLVLGVMDVMRR